MEREIRTAAKWWADQLPKPKPPIGVQAGAPAGDDMHHPMVGGMWATLQAKEAESVTPEAVALFRVSLERVLRDSLVDHKGDPWPEKYSGMGFGTDYHPDLILGTALECAGLNGYSMTLLPAKSVMWFGPGFVKPAAGYRNPGETIPLVED